MYIIHDAKDKDIQWISSIVASRSNPSAGGGVIGLSTVKKFQVFSVLSPVLRKDIIFPLEAVEIDGKYSMKTLGYSMDICNIKNVSEQFQY